MQKKLSQKPTALRLPVFQFAIIELSGIILYNRRFEKELMDEFLFSGFSAAIIAFSKELGTTLYMISMKDVNFFFKELGDFFIVIASDPAINNEDVKTLIETITNQLISIELNKLPNINDYFLTDEFDDFILQAMIHFQIEQKGNVIK